MASVSQYLFSQPYPDSQVNNLTVGSNGQINTSNVNFGAASPQDFDTIIDLQLGFAQAFNQESSTQQQSLLNEAQQGQTTVFSMMENSLSSQLFNQGQPYYNYEQQVQQATNYQSGLSINQVYQLAVNTTNPIAKLALLYSAEARSNSLQIYSENSQMISESLQDMDDDPTWQKLQSDVEQGAATADAPIGSDDQDDSNFIDEDYSDSQGSSDSSS